MTDESAQTLRSFISINLTPALTQALDQLQTRLQGKIGSGVSWTKPEQIHLTLKFLGDIEAASLDALKAALDRAGAGIASHELTLENLGAFPSTKKPSVIWVGIGGEVDALLELQRRVEQETRSLSSHDEDRTFKPHLTIGRVKARHFREQQRIGGIVQSTQVGVLGRWKVGSVQLMKSQLGPQGSRHTELHSVTLQ